MSRIVTIRLSDEEYREIAAVAKKEHRPISNFITLFSLVFLVIYDNLMKKRRRD